MGDDERCGGRATVEDALAETVRSHYDRLDRIADDVNRLGFMAAAAILKEALPRTDKARSGDLGEILPPNLSNRKPAFAFLSGDCAMDGREMALRGDDFIEVGYDNDDKLWLLKVNREPERHSAKRDHHSGSRGALPVCRTMHA